MIIKRLLLLLFILMVWTPSHTQDLHYTQYNMAPLSLNPGFTGAFYGTFRIGGIYRDQFFNVSGFNGSFKTPNIYIDAPIIKGFRDKDWVGIGLTMLQDKAGSLELTNGQFMGSGAYHIGLGKDGNSTIAIGIQAGYVSRGFLNVQTNHFNEPEMVPQDNINYFDLAAGAVYRGALGKNSLLEMGVSAWHLTGPDNSIKNNDRLTRRFGAHARLKNYITNDFTVTPSFLFMTQKGGGNELSLQTVAGFMIDPVKELEINAGLGYRFNDLSSLELLGGVVWKNFKAGFGYDFGLSSASFEGGQQPGAFELAASYIVMIHKEPKPKPTIFCPRF